MKPLATRIIIAAALAGAPAMAQDLGAELVFDDQSLFEDAASDSTSQWPDIKATLSYFTTQLGGTTSSLTTLRLDGSDRYDLGSLGFLDWAGHAIFDDQTGAGGGRFALDRVQLQNSTGNLSWKIGKFPIGWGEIEGVPVLDVLNAGPSLATVGTATADLPGQWFVSADYFAANTTFSGFVGLAPEVAHLAPAAPTGTPREFGLRATFARDQGQTSLYAARLVPQSGVVDLASGLSFARPYTLIGASAYQALGGVLLEVDLAAKFGLERASATGLVAHDRLDAALGIEYAASNTTQITASVAVQHWLVQDAAYFDVGPAGPVASAQTSASYLLGATTSVLGGNLGLSLYLGGALDGSADFAAFSLDYSLSDALKLKASLSQISARQRSILAPLDGTRNVMIGAEYFF
jgi:hypothetical protein